MALFSGIASILIHGFFYLIGGIPIFILGYTRQGRFIWTIRNLLVVGSCLGILFGIVLHGELYPRGGTIIAGFIYGIWTACICRRFRPAEAPERSIPAGIED